MQPAVVCLENILKSKRWKILPEDEDIRSHRAHIVKFVPIWCANGMQMVSILKWQITVIAIIIITAHMMQRQAGHRLQNDFRLDDWGMRDDG